MLHEHPIKIFRYTAKNLWLLIFPLLRSAHFFPFSAKEAAAWLHGAWFDLLICLLILTYGAIRWFYCGFTYNTEVIRKQSGIFLKKRLKFPAVASLLSRKNTLFTCVHSVQYGFRFTPERETLLVQICNCSYIVLI